MNTRELQKEANSHIAKRKLSNEFWKVIENLRRPTPNYTFNREECYDRKVFHRQ
jgi:hypothetical protein